MRQSFCRKCNSQTKALNFMKLYYELHPDINWWLSTFGETRSEGDAIILRFPEFLK